MEEGILNLDTYIKILERVKEMQGGGLEVSKVVKGREILPTPYLANMKVETDSTVSFKRWDPNFSNERKVLLV